MSELPQFISASVVERLKSGAFVPYRRTKPGQLHLQERRDTLSPLAVVKRSIRYEPAVFEHRKEQVLTLVDWLNSASKKVILIGGEQGTGKTSLTRAAVELMGGHQEQILWYDISRHSDFEDVIQFLLQYIQYLSLALGQPVQGQISKGDDSPFDRLDAMLKTLKTIPLLIVIDNLEYLVDSSLKLHSFPFKELVNFLLKYPNIKLMMIGERLPYADLTPGFSKSGNSNDSMIAEIKLQGLDQTDVQTVFEKRSPGTLSPEESQQLYRLTSGYPWLVKALLYLNQHAHYSLENLLAEMFKTSNKPEEAQPLLTPIETLIRLIYQGLTPAQQKAVQLLVLMRHALNSNTLIALVQFCFPDQDPKTLHQDLNDLEHSLLRPVMKINYPPQEVLTFLQQANRSPDEKFKPWFDLYRSFKKLVYKQIPAFERTRLHDCLSEFYRNEKNHGTEERLSKLKTSALIQEAKFHQQMAQQRREILGDSTLPSDATIETKQYLTSNTRPQPSALEKRYTLDDYRKITIPDTEPISNDEGPEISNEDLQLTEEEKRLLGLSLSEPEPIPSATAGTQTIIVEKSVPTPIAEDQPLEQKPENTKPTDKRQNLKALTDSLYRQEQETDEHEKAIQQKLATAVANRNKPELFRQLMALAEYRLNKGLYQSAEECLEKVLALEHIPKELFADVYRFKGRIHLATYKHNSAITYLHKAETLILENADQTSDRRALKLMQIYQELAEIYQFRKQYDLVLSSLEKAVSLGEKPDNPDWMGLLAEIYFKLATVYDALDNIEQACYFYEKSAHIDEPQGHFESCGSAWSNIGSLQAEQGKFDEAIASLKQALRFDRLAKHTEGQIRTLDAMAAIYQEQKQPEQAESIYKEVLALAIQEGSALWKADTYLKLGNLYAEQKNWHNALQHYLWARQSGTAELSDRSLAHIDQRIKEVQRVVDQ